MDKATKTEVKHAAQDALLDALQTAFYRLYDDHEQPPAGWTKEEYLAEMNRQRDRIKKLFGYEV
jgi:hypothetical protein